MSPKCWGCTLMSDDPFKPIGSAGKAKAKAAAPEWSAIVPVPPDAPKAPGEHPKLGRPSQIWTYRDAAGEILGHVYRFDGRDGKSYRPLCYFAGKADQRAWRWESWPEPRPLYRLDQLSAGGLLIIAEGEKAADAIVDILDLPATTSPAGAKSAAKANWQPVAGRDVVIWPDADKAGADFAATVARLARLAGAKSVRIVSPPAGVAEGWDAADARASGWDAGAMRGLIDGAAPFDIKIKDDGKAGEDDGEGKRPRQRDTLIAAADGAELWHSPTRQPFASVPVNGHREHFAIGSAAFDDWLAGRYYEATGNAPSGQLLTDARRVLAVRAIETGAEHEPALRVAWHDGASWLDLGDSAWRAVRVGPNGWAIVENPPVKFIRPVPLRPLPDPEPGELLEALRGFINAEDRDYHLIVSWLVAALWGRGTSFPVLALGGEQGSGKTTMARMLRSLVDPSAVPALSLPKDERDLIVVATTAHVLSFDNVSKIDAWFSDAICRLSTGGGFLTRKLHSDSEPFLFQGSRPILLNGIPALAERADLAERSLTVRLLTIDETTRESEDDFLVRWNRALPGILGALLDAISRAVAGYDQVKLTRMPRMAAFAKLMAAAEPGLGWEPGTFDAAYSDNRRMTADAAFEADPVAMAIARLMQDRDATRPWEGTATMLLSELNALVTEDMRRSRFWPTKVNALGAAVSRAAPLLRGKGVEVTHRRAGDQRTIVLTVKA